MEEIKKDSITLVNPNDKKEFKEIGFIMDERVKVYITNRNFYKHQYALYQAYYFEIELIDLLISRNVKFIIINEIHKNEISGIDEHKTFIFPIELIKKIGMPKLEHEIQGFDKQIGIPREILLNFEI